MVKSKYPIDTSSKEYMHGYACFMCNRAVNYYSSRTDYQKYKNQKFGFNKAKDDSESFGKENAYNSWRMRTMLEVVGKSKQEIRTKLQLPDGNVYLHEYNAVTLSLTSTSDAFNNGRNAFLNGENDICCPYSSMVEYGDYINWKTGFQCTKLAVELHSRKKVFETF